MWMLKLEEMLTGRSFDELLTVKAVDVVTMVDGGVRLVVRLSAELQHAVTRLDEASIPSIATQWAAQDELYGVEADPGDATVALGELRGLWGMAVQRGWHCYCWVCV